MNKSELVGAVCDRTASSRTVADLILSAAFDIIVQQVAEGGYVRLAEFGTFVASHKQARVGRNPRTGEQMVIPSRHLPLFRAANRFKNEVIQGHG